MKACPYCGEENIDEATFCQYCSKDLTATVKDNAGKKVPKFSMRTIAPIVKIKNPLLGGIGIVLIVLGLATAMCGKGTGGFPVWVIIMIAVGLILLVYSLITGNIKFWD